MPADPKHKLTVLVTGINFALFLCRAAVAGDLQNDLFDDTLPMPRMTAPIISALVQISLIACTVGFASVMSSMLHCKKWNDITKNVASGVGVITLMLCILSAGYCAKYFDLELNDQNESIIKDKDTRQKMSALAYMGLFQMVTQLLYVVLVNSITEGVVALPTQEELQTPKITGV
eukprot:m.14571 g.14571  ORF g.14571 m.14571 type:complete len:175 (-) comp5134_c0_seq1:51-575(-)